MTNTLRVFLCLIVCLLFHLALYAQVEWYLPYEEAKEAIKAGNWNLAEQKLNAAIQKNPKSDRQARPTGVFPVSYTPYYYLGKVYFNQRKWQKAVDTLKRDLNLFSETDNEFKEMNSLIAKATDALKPDVEPLIAAIKEAVSRGDLEEAKKNLQQLRNTDPQNPAIPQFEKQILLSASLQRVNDLIAQAQLDQAEQEIRKLKNDFATNPEVLNLEKRILQIRNEIEALKGEINESINREQFSEARNKLEEIRKKNATEASISPLKEKIAQRENDVIERDTIRTLVVKLKDAVDRRSWNEAQTVAKEIKQKQPQNPDLVSQEPLIQRGVRFLDLMEKAKKARDRKNFQPARDFAKQAEATQIDTNEVSKLLVSIDLAEKWDKLQRATAVGNWNRAAQLYAELEPLDRSNPKLPIVRVLIEKNLPKVPLPEPFPNKEEEQALTLFYGGSYSKAAEEFAKIGQKNKSPLVLFYLACSHAAQALKEGDKARLEKAKAEFAQLRNIGNQFQPDTRFISPRILALYPPGQ